MVAAGSSEMVSVYQTTQCHIPEDHNQIAACAKLGAKLKIYTL
jgi:hypothetical protein